MNARLYDPRIGRFLSPDNYITDPENPQSYNRYSYVLNNPLKYTDPTGNYGYIPYQGQFEGTNLTMDFSMDGLTQGMLGMNLWLDIKYSIDLCAFEFYLSAGMMGTFGKYLLDPTGGWGGYKSRSISAGADPMISRRPKPTLSPEAAKKIGDLALSFIKLAMSGINPYTIQQDKMGCNIAAAATIINLLGTYSGKLTSYSTLVPYMGRLYSDQNWKENGLTAEQVNPFITSCTGVEANPITKEAFIKTALDENNIVLSAIYSPDEGGAMGYHGVVILENAQDAFGNPLFIIWNSAGNGSFEAIYPEQLVPLKTFTDTKVDIWGFSFKHK